MVARKGNPLRPLGRFVAVLLAASAAATASGQQSIYTCVDAKGRRLTADRPIAECLDREQQLLGANGSRSRIGPSLSPEERAAQEEKARRSAEEQSRLAEERRRDRSLLSRYPDEGSHQDERRSALLRVNETLAASQQRLAALQAERQQLQADRAKATDPVNTARLQRLLDQVDQDEAAQKRLMAGQAEEKRRIDARFDEELQRLRPQWAERAGTRTARAADPAMTPAVSRPASSAAAR